MKTRPDTVTDEHLTYLDDLRESGITNMFGASSYVQNRFNTTKNESRDILSYWMTTFEERQRGITETEINQMAVQSEMNAKSQDNGEE